ncbi:MAG: cytochrome b/b6 domain-containing protein [Pseudomonadota bacterium]
MARILMYTRFERLWHWSQALLIISMLITGFEVHGLYSMFGFEKAADYHVILAWTLMGLWVFAIFWHLTTGEWKQYIPSSPSKLIAMAKYYAVDIFMGVGHPYHKSREQKLNPLQRMAYLSFHLFISPLLWISGLLYLFYANWNEWGVGILSLNLVALAHTAGAFLLATFLVAHLYLALTMSEKFAHLKAMITGMEEE